MSRLVNCIEERLNIRLLKKKGRELAATKDGEAALQRWSSGMNPLHQGFSSLFEDAGCDSRQDSFAAAL